MGLHGLPISGKEKIAKELTIYRDGIQYVYDETIKGINKNMSVDEIVNNFNMPAKYTSSLLATETYGEIEYFIRGIYSGLLGWFGHDPVELHPASEDFEAKKIVEGFGGLDKILSDAKAAIADKEYSWAAQLLTYIIKANPDNAEAKQLKADVYRSMAHITPATSTRHFYMVNAMELEGKVNMLDLDRKPEPIVVQMLPMGTFVELYRLNADASKMLDTNIKVAIEFTDKNTKYGLHIRSGIVQYLETVNNEYVTLKMTFADWCNQIASKKMDFATAIKAGVITAKGSDAQIKQVEDVFAFSSHSKK